jgi:hypothetical protein
MGHQAVATNYCKAFAWVDWDDCCHNWANAHDSYRSLHTAKGFQVGGGGAA